jgi:hypothetical protein
VVAVTLDDAAERVGDGVAVESCGPSSIGRVYVVDNLLDSVRVVFVETEWGWRRAEYLTAAGDPS